MINLGSNTITGTIGGLAFYNAATVFNPAGTTAYVTSAAFIVIIIIIDVATSTVTGYPYHLQLHAR